jgi:hypothetical protein
VKNANYKVHQCEFFFLIILLFPPGWAKYSPRQIYPKSRQFIKETVHDNTGQLKSQTKRRNPLTALETVMSCIDFHIDKHSVLMLFVTVLYNEILRTGR